MFLERVPAGSHLVKGGPDLTLAASKASIVIADEQSLFREALAALCEQTGRYEVVGHCPDGESALTMILSLRPQLAIVDLQLPRLFTFELISKIRQSGSTTRVVVLSPRSDRKTVIEGLRCGASAFVMKSGPARNLLDALQQCLQGGVFLSPEIHLENIFIARQPAAPVDPLSQLSSREYQVFSLLVEGIRAKEIAARLDLSPKTVDTYRASLMRKLDIHDVAGLVKFAIGRNLIASHR
jgi:DNA-binding NarL/FixJ family response regulator